jgi:hypothetical protein
VLFLLGLVFIVIVVIIIILAVGSLFFGGEDHYERELARMDYEDAVLDRLD